MGKTFVGFGFGPIQSALFLYEAYASGQFDRFVISEVEPELVAAVNTNGGRYTVNIARPAGIDRAEVHGVELLNPRQPQDRERIVQAIAVSDEMATALPSVNIYGAGGGASVVSLLQDGLAARREPLPTILYAAENNNHAAELLDERLDAAGVDREQAQFQVLNTVVGKMSGVITDRETIERLDLATLTPPSSSAPRAVLVEEFNRILVSQVKLPGYQRGIAVFQEKPDLLPFEEAKLYGHNAIHALIAYLGEARDHENMAQAGSDPVIAQIAERAFLDESGVALIRRHQSLQDPLFTTAGFREYALDLLERMRNPHLNDLIARVGRDQARKLGWDDRLFGTMRLALGQGVQPTNLALGAAAGVLSLIRHRDQVPEDLPVPEESAPLTRDRLHSLLQALWPDADLQIAAQLEDLTWTAWQTVVLAEPRSQM